MVNTISPEFQFIPRESQIFKIGLCSEVIYAEEESLVGFKGLVARFELSQGFGSKSVSDIGYRYVVEKFWLNRWLQRKAAKLLPHSNVLLKGFLPFFLTMDRSFPK